MLRLFLKRQQKLSALTQSGKFSFSTVDLQSEIEAEIKASPVVIYSKSFCPFCVQTKDIFKALEIDPKAHVYELDKMSDGS